MARNNIIYAPTVNNYSSSLNGAISSSATTITLNSVTGLQNLAGILVIDRVDSSGNLTPSKQEWIYFNGISGSAVTLPSAVDGRGVGGSTAQSHADGAIVEAVFDVTIWGGMTTTYSAEHTDAGQHTGLISNTLGLSSNASIAGGLFTNTLAVASTASVTGITNLTSLNIVSAASIANRLNVTSFAALSLASLPLSSVQASSLVNSVKFSVFRTAALNSANSFTAVAMDTKTFDTGSNVDIVTNKGRFTAPVAGFYYFTGTASNTTALNTVISTALYKNGSQVKLGNQLDPTQVSGSNSSVVSGIIQLAATDYVELYFIGGSGSAMAVGAAACYFDGFLIAST